MESLHRRIIILVIWLGCFYNIERIDLTSANTINLMSSAYIVGTVAAVLPLLPLVRRLSFLYLVIVVSILHILLLLISATPLVGGIYTYLSITGYVMVLVTLFLSYRVAQATHEFHDAVEQITFSDMKTRLRGLQDAEEMINIQMLSSRRGHRPLSIILFETDHAGLAMATHRLVRNVQESMMQRYVVSNIAGLINQHVRRTDLMARDEQSGHLLVVAPETDHTHALVMAHRLQGLIQGRMGIRARWSTATFPQHALTFEKLRDMAQQKLLEQRTIQFDEQQAEGYSPLKGSEKLPGFPEYSLSSPSTERRATIDNGR